MFRLRVLEAFSEFEVPIVSETKRSRLGREPVPMLRSPEAHDDESVRTAGTAYMPASGDVEIEIETEEADVDRE